MNTNEITEDKLNLFIDKQLDTDEMNEIHQASLDDKDVRERICQLKAVRELVGYAYSEVPPSRYEESKQTNSNSIFAKAIAASVTLVVGVLLGWSTYQYSPNSINAVSAENAFQYVANRVTVDHAQRKIVLHIDSGDLQVVNAALNEVDYLLATYRNAKAPLKLDVVTNKGGINILRPEVSPYISRIQKMVDNENVSFFACRQSIDKARKKEGVEIVMMPGVITDKTAKDIIPGRLKDGWVYIKA
jgi:intracellular sulfur oxidation DsrE/DsrF family protein